MFTMNATNMFNIDTNTYMMVDKNQKNVTDAERMVGNWG
jgi:hypothetical protein